MVKIWFILDYSKEDKNPTKMSKSYCFLFHMIIFIQEKYVWPLNIPLASKTASSPFLSFLLLTLGNSGSRLYQPARRLCLMLSKLYEYSIRSGIPQLKKLDSLQFNLQAGFDLI